VTLGERIDTKQNLSGIWLGNPNGTIDRTDRYVGPLNINSIAKNDQLNDQVASHAIKWKAGQWIRQVALVATNEVAIMLDRLGYVHRQSAFPFGGQP
jgi:hypothetical protein